MTVDEAEAILRRVTYKPGCSFSFWKSESGEPLALMMHATNLQSATCEGRINIHFHRPVWSDDLPLWNEYDLLQAVQALCSFVEEHERDEWLKIDGRHVKEPEH